MAGAIYRKPVALAVMATVTVLIGSVVTMAYPMLREDMHPRLEKLRPFSPLELAGRDIYQREGCINCHTQVVRPLRSEVLRYGEYSKAGEFAFDNPFLWGSKRTGPDLAREGGKRPDSWHLKHYTRPQDFEPKSNMPAYAFLASAKLDPAEARANYAAMARLHREFRAPEADFAALSGKSEMDAIIAYTQQLGHAVQRRQAGGAFDLAALNPLAGKPEAIARGAKVFLENCAVCHGERLEGETEIAPNLLDAEVLGAPGDISDGAYFALIAGGSDAKAQVGRPGIQDGGMTAFTGQLSSDDIWAAIAYIRSKQGKQEGP